MFKKVTMASIFLMGLLICVHQSYAIIIGPSRLEVSMAKGETAEIDYYAQNEAEAPIHVAVEAENWFKGTEAYDIKPEDWLELSISEFDLEPMEIKKLKLIVKVPQDATGEMVAQIFFSSGVTGESVLPGAIRARLGAILYVAIEGTEIVDGHIEDIVVARGIQGDEDALKIGVRVKNEGNVHLRPTGSVVIEDLNGEKILEKNIASGRAVLPGQDFLYYALPDKTKLSKGEYKVKATVKYGTLFKVEKTSTFEKLFKVGVDGEVIQK
ncbi:MAG: hypothetical protein ABID09_03025 [Candidatus Omnitrophota bacterium]